MKPRLLRARLLRWVLGSVLLIGAAWLVSGGLADPFERLFVAALSLTILFATFALDPDLVRERLHPGPGGVDRTMPPVARVLALTMFVVGLLDGGRFRWSAPPPEPLRLAGVALFAASITWAMWAIAVNRFWSPVVRIQSERGHHVVTGGPYSLVRHPGYIGILIAFPASALALGSWWALLPAAVFAIVVMRRVIIEDRYLTSHLEGYRDYAGMVRYRLVPGLW